MKVVYSTDSLIIFDPRLISILDFVDKKHHGITRKYNGEPYVMHLIRVACTVKDAGGSNEQVAAALCHDVIEDTDATRKEISSVLRFAGYNVNERTTICNMVQELTNLYTSKNFPDTPRALRKRLEAERLWKISDEAQTIKYADILDNTSDVMEHDAHFGAKYLEEKKYVVSGMKYGEPTLREKVLEQLNLEVACV